eukprot:COSAG02_NODE_27253_length_613_cov_40.017510_1_plen_55_part_01
MRRVPVCCSGRRGRDDGRTECVASRASVAELARISAFRGARLPADMATPGPSASR